MKPTKTILEYIAYLIAFCIWLVPVVVLIAGGGE